MTMREKERRAIGKSDFRRLIEAEGVSPVHRLAIVLQGKDD